MSHAEKCLICLGDGVIEQMGVHSKLVEIKCHGCEGKGWITIHDKVEYQPVPQFPSPFDTYPWWTQPVTWTSGTNTMNLDPTSGGESFTLTGAEGEHIHFNFADSTCTAGDTNTISWTGGLDFTDEERDNLK